MTPTLTLAALQALLVLDGMAALARPREPVAFTGDTSADALLNDINGHPHAFLMAALVDRQVPAERAWWLPASVRDRLGTFEISDLAELSEEAWVALLLQPPALHRFPQTMATVLHRAVARIIARYHGDASRIWSERPSSATVVRRVLEFHGGGPKIATMVANILVRDFKVELSDYRYVDISADVHVCRVMGRLGFVEPGASTDVVVYTAREATPDFQ